MMGSECTTAVTVRMLESSAMVGIASCVHIQCTNVYCVEL